VLEGEFTMRILMAALCALACTSVRVVQREGCWVRETQNIGGTREELGFCKKAAPEWSEDRLARVVQECMAQADYRWENRALAAWSRGEPIPPPDGDEQIAKACMGQASAALGIGAENTALRTRLAELGQDRDALRSAADQERQFLEQSSDKMVAALGEAAKRPAPTATATATSTGTAKTESDLPAAQPTTVVGIGAAPATPVKVRAPAACVPRKTIPKVAADKCKDDCEKATPAAPQPG
jgi:hypothetical protein